MTETPTQRGPCPPNVLSTQRDGFPSKSCSGPGLGVHSPPVPGGPSEGKKEGVTSPGRWWAVTVSGGGMAGEDFRGWRGGGNVFCT